MGVTQYRLAMDLKIPHSRGTAIIRGRRAKAILSFLKLHFKTHFKTDRIAF